MSIGQRIRDARKKAGLTQEQLAIACNVATITIRQYETNKREPRYEQLKSIARVLKVDWADLVDGDDAAEMVKRHMLDMLNGKKEPAHEQLSQALLAAFSQLNDEGQGKAVERVEELTEIPKYQKEKPPQD